MLPLMALLQDPPLWFVILGVVAMLGLVIGFWRSRSSLRHLDRRGYPEVEPRDRSAIEGPRARVGEWFDPNATGRDDPPPRT